MSDVSAAHPVITQALTLGPPEGSYSIIIPVQSSLAQAALHYSSGSSSAQNFPGCCRDCRFWSGPAGGEFSGYCNRLLLSDFVVLTPIEDASLSARHDFLFTPADFACKYFSSKLKAEEV